ncbi:DUF2271 domain-containing protein [Fontimonas thermophila]|nr:DUF2271 domain-containing protein [Fontimonas thermophila]
MYRRIFQVVLCALTVDSAHAAALEVSVQIPQLSVAEYHRPYVAMWIERPDRSVVANLAVWYQQKRGGGSAEAAGAGAPEGGTKWLPDLRQWWRRSGRALALPVDGVTGATRPVGTHVLRFVQGHPPLGELTPGRYRLLVEAVREEGGREVLELPFEWPVAAPTELKVDGQSELDSVKLSLAP